MKNFLTGKGGADPEKKEVIGAAIYDYRFYASSIGSTRFDDEGSSEAVYWHVFNKIGDACLIKVNNESEQPNFVWVKCDNYMNIVDYLKGTTTGIDRNNIFYKSPRGEIFKPPFDKSSDEDDIVIDILESKDIGGETWLYIHITDGCGDNKDAGKAWVPLYRGDDLNVKYYTRGC